MFFGATGDLAYKKIFPALQAMVKRGTLNVPVIGGEQPSHGRCTRNGRVIVEKPFGRDLSPAPRPIPATRPKRCVLGNQPARVLPLVTHIADGENGGVRMHVFQRSAWN